MQRVATYSEIERQWSLVDLLKCNLQLDYLHAAKLRQSER